MTLIEELGEVYQIDFDGMRTNALSVADAEFEIFYFVPLLIRQAARSFGISEEEKNQAITQRKQFFFTKDVMDFVKNHGLNKFDELASYSTTIYASEAAKRAAQEKFGSAIHFRLDFISRYIQLLCTRHNLLKEVNLEKKTAIQLADQLASNYGVTVEVVADIQQFNAQETILRGVKENVYFVAESDPDRTADITGHMLRRSAIRNEQLLREPQTAIKHDSEFKARGKLLIKIANQERAVKSDRKAVSIGAIITAIKEEYATLHQGSEPSLRELANLLTERGVATPGGGGKWQAEQVRRIIARTEKDAQQER